MEQRHAAHPSAGIRLTELAARANMTKQATAEIVAEIERREYLQRTTDPADRRAKIIEFTDQGWATVNLALSALAELEAEIAGRLVIAADNFSVMAAVLRRAASMAAQHLDRWEIIDHASDDKPDVPSGTSRELAETLAQVREPAVTVALSDLHGPVEARGAEVAGTQIHSVRLPSFAVTTEVVFGGPDERLIMRHDPGLTPAPYVTGTLLAVRHVTDAAGVRRGLDSLLFGEHTQDPGP